MEKEYHFHLGLEKENNLSEKQKNLSEIHNFFQ